MKISIVQSDDIVRKTYTLVLKNESTTMNIGLGPCDLSEKIGKLVSKAKEGIADQVAGILLLPAGNSITIRICGQGMSYTYICPSSELEFE